MIKGPQDTDLDHEGWLMESWPLTDYEQGPLHTLVRCVAIVDRSMRHTGTLDRADHDRPEFQEDALEAANILRFPVTQYTFRLPRERLTERWYEIFDDLVLELRSSWNRSMVPWACQFSKDDIAYRYLINAPRHPWDRIGQTISAYLDDRSPRKAQKALAALTVLAAALGNPSRRLDHQVRDWASSFRQEAEFLREKGVTAVEFMLESGEFEDAWSQFDEDEQERRRDELEYLLMSLEPPLPVKKPARTWLRTSAYWTIFVGLIILTNVANRQLGFWKVFPVVAGFAALGVTYQRRLGRSWRSILWGDRR